MLQERNFRNAPTAHDAHPRGWNHERCYSGGYGDGDLESTGDRSLRQGRGCGTAVTPTIVPE
jgi:hypothetical protein